MHRTTPSLMTARPWNSWQNLVFWCDVLPDAAGGAGAGLAGAVAAAGGDSPPVPGPARPRHRQAVPRQIVSQVLCRAKQ